ncbi:type VI secretion system ImpA family N-terminal domain-containing protein, partial [Marinobacter sp.]|uniref:type VI secretion system ImpA family N-terminal domain-containing protein n=1 Tax=Marinobacter sp. TaxID=50741 RepID=UPI0025BC765E
MQVIEQHPYIEQVVRPLEGESPAGRGLGEDAALVILEDEIMKIGSLAHTDIDWGKVESESLKILSARSKDLKVLGFLLIALQRGGDGERFALSRPSYQPQLSRRGRMAFSKSVKSNNRPSIR